jgi:Cu(I)/Ag(I) efflux system membrane fusion protein
VRWLAALAVLAALAAGVWFAQTHGWLKQGYTWVQHRLAGHGTSGGSGMDMPGMDMGSMEMGEPTDVAGHAEVMLPGGVRQRIGVTVGNVKESPLEMTVRTVGIIQPDETKVAHVHLKTEGWIEGLGVNYTGERVQKGQRLLSIYSPEYLQTQQDFVRDVKDERGRTDGGRRSIAALSRRRLELWDVPADEIKKLEEGGEPQKTLTLRSPLEGTVLTKNAFIGQRVTPETELYVIADLKKVWVQAKVYEYELPHVQVNQSTATVTLSAVSGREFTGTVKFIQPVVEAATRTAQVRIELDNIDQPGKDWLLKPGMFAQVTIHHDMGKGLLVPASAIVHTGERDVAYRVESPGRYVPVTVKVSSLRFGDRYQVLQGLKKDEEVVTSANFLIDSESRLRGGGGMMNMPGMDMGGKKGKEGVDKMGDMKDMPGMKEMDPGKMKH